MTKHFLALGILFALSTATPAWFDKGHMVVARLAWKELDGRQRARIVALLQKHPHYKTYLAAKRPEGFAEAEWVFLRAATWPDWVGKHHSRDFHHGPWHYINYPFVPPGSRSDARLHQPKAGGEDIVQALGKSVEAIKTGTDSEKAIALCWLLHLVGDIHQPLHCAQLVSEKFPKGDQGGNLFVIRLRTHPTPVKLHAFWDGLLGTGTTHGSIGKACLEVEAVSKDKVTARRAELDRNTTFESWAKESFELAKTAAYLNGDLKSGEVKKDPGDDEAPEVPADYAANAGRTARRQIGKAGIRLAAELGRLFPRG